MSLTLESLASLWAVATSLAEPPYSSEPRTSCVPTGQMRRCLTCRSCGALVGRGVPCRDLRAR